MCTIALLLLFFCDISRQYFTALSVFLGTGFSRVITAADLCTVERAIERERARASTYLERMAGSVHMVEQKLQDSKRIERQRQR